MDQLDLMEVLRRAAKYLIEGGAVALAACLILSKNKLNMGEVCALAVTAAAVFAILELYSPAIGASARTGAD